MIVTKEMGNNLATAKGYEVSEANVRRRLKDSDRLRSCSSTLKSFSSSRKGRHPVLKEEVFAFIWNARNLCIAVNSEMVQVRQEKSLGHMNSLQQNGIPSSKQVLGAAVHDVPWSLPSTADIGMLPSARRL